MCDDKVCNKISILVTNQTQTNTHLHLSRGNRPIASFGDEILCKNVTDTFIITCVCGFCTQLLRNGTEREPNTAASHLTDPLVLFQHMVALFSYFGNGFQKVEQLQIQFSHLESTLRQHSTHLEQLTKNYTELQQKTEESLQRMPVLEKQNGTRMDKNWTLKFHEASLSGSNYEIRVMDLEKRVEELYRQQAALKTHTSELEMQLQASLTSTHTWQVQDQGTQGGHLNTGGSRELHPVSRANLDQLIQRAQPSPVQASTSYNAGEVEHLQPSFIRVLQNGGYVWRIDDVSRYQQSAAAIRSPPFLTAHTGYKMCIEACLNGDGTSLQLRFILMKGEYDPLLKWPFDCQVTIVLIDQTHREHIWYRFQPDCDNPSFQRPLSDSNVPYNVPRFTELPILTNTRYVKDDVMFIKCIVNTTNIFHP